VSADDINSIFEPQLKQVKKDHLLENQSSWNALKKYLAEVVLTMVCYFVHKNIDRSTYINATKKNEWSGEVQCYLIYMHSIVLQLMYTLFLKAERRYHKI